MFKFILLLLTIFIMSCGVKNDVIPPEEPWVIFEYSKEKKENIIQKKKKEKEKDKK